MRFQSTEKNGMCPMCGTICGLFVLAALSGCEFMIEKEKMEDPGVGRFTGSFSTSRAAVLAMSPAYSVASVIFSDATASSIGCRNDSCLTEVVTSYGFDVNVPSNIVTQIRWAGDSAVGNTCSIAFMVEDALKKMGTFIRQESAPCAEITDIDKEGGSSAQCSQLMYKVPVHGQGSMRIITRLECQNSGDGESHIYLDSYDISIAPLQRPDSESHQET